MLHDTCISAHAVTQEQINKVSAGDFAASDTMKVSIFIIYMYNIVSDYICLGVYNMCMDRVSRCKYSKLK